jgi:hypothetical protein
VQCSAVSLKAKSEVSSSTFDEAWFDALQALLPIRCRAASTSLRLPCFDPHMQASVQAFPTGNSREARSVFLSKV